MNEHVSIRAPYGQAGYDNDFYAWSRSQAELIRHRQLDLIDIENLAEEIENLARKELRSVEKRLRTLIEHLLKLQFFTLSEDPKRGWRVTIAKTRANLASMFRDSPSLHSQREAFYFAAWQSGSRVAALAIADDPRAAAAIAQLRDISVFTVDQALDPDFFPGG